MELVRNKPIGYFFHEILLEFVLPCFDILKGTASLLSLLLNSADSVAVGTALGYSLGLSNRVLPLISRLGYCSLVVPFSKRTQLLGLEE